MSVHISHLVLVALGDTDDHVVDESADGSEGSDILARAVVQLNVDDILLRVREGDCQMAQVLAELAARALDGDLTGLDVDLDCRGYPLACVFSLTGLPISFNLQFAYAYRTFRGRRIRGLGAYVPPSGMVSDSWE